MDEIDDDSIIELVDLETGEVAGAIQADGVVVHGDQQLRARVARAMGREVMARDGELVEELGICFLDVQTLHPGDSGHAAIVIQNLGQLAGYLPRRRKQSD